MQHKVIAIVLCFIVGSCLNFSAKTSAIIQKKATSSISSSLSNSSLCFTENKGQWDSSIQYIGNTSFGRVAFTNKGIWYETKDRVQNNEPLSFCYLSLSFINSDTPIIQATKPLSHCTNYMIGNDTSKWGIQCKSYAQITYKDIWPHIDMQYYFTREGLKYDYLVHPGGNIEKIQIEVQGAEIETSPSFNSLLFKHSNESLLDDQLAIYIQETNQPIMGFFAETHPNQYGFKLHQESNESFLDQTDFSTNQYDPENDTLVIDPLVYSTYLGGQRSDQSDAVFVDSQNCVYTAGWTNSIDFPTTKTPEGGTIPGYDQSYNGVRTGQTYDSYIVKLNEHGTELEYATYIGGKRDEVPTSLLPKASMKKLFLDIIKAFLIKIALSHL